jgi:O-antigen/teichoic acid export membrane protein
VTAHRGWVGSGLLVGAGIGVWSVGNWIFFILVGRLLGPREYGLVAALLSGCLVIFVLCSGLQPTLAQSNRGNPPDAIFVRALRLTIMTTVVVMVAGAAVVLMASTLISGFPTAATLGAVAVLAAIAVFPLSLGQLQAEGRFGSYALGFITVGITRPLAFLALWFCGIKVLSPLLGTSASWIIGSAVTLVFARRALGSPPIARTATQWHAFRRALIPNTAGITAIAILTNADVITARLVLPDRTAGLFAAASAISQGLFLVPQVFITLVLPRLAARRAQGRSSAALAATGVLATLATGVVFVALALPLGQALMRLTFGAAFRDSGTLLPYYGTAMTCMGCTIVLLYHQLARRDFRYSWCLLGIAAAQIAGLALFARSPNAIITVDLVCALGAVVIHELLARGAGERIVDGLRQRSSA